MKIRDLLEAKGAAVETVRADATIAEAVVRLTQRGIGALVVSADGDRVEGILSERDIVRELSKGPDALGEPVSAAMTTKVTTCAPTDDVVSLMAVMTDQRIRHVPVLDAGHLAGIVSIGDVVKSRVDDLERERKELLDYVSGR